MGAAAEVRCENCNNTIANADIPPHRAIQCVGIIRSTEVSRASNIRTIEPDMISSGRKTHKEPRVEARLATSPLRNCWKSE